MIPTVAECFQQMDRYRMLGHIKDHSIIVARVSALLAEECVKAGKHISVPLVVTSALLHDIGKAVDHEIEGTHAGIGRDLAKKFGEAPEIVYAIAAHHEDVPPESLLDIIVKSADALSGARPGARKEMLESYVKRLEDLEQIATSFDGIDTAFAIQAGREIRVVVDSGEVTDAESVVLSRDIAKKIEQDLTYPGQIRVTLIRETRAVEYAK